LAVTNCLNFGNPYKPEMYYHFAECVRGMGEACRFFETPVTGGNVSFYNEDAERAVYPTPTIGMIGKIESLDLITTADFKSPGDCVALIGECRDEIGGSEYLRTIHGKVTGEIPVLDMSAERRAHQFLLQAIRSGWIRSAHDCSDGGLAVALFECCLSRDNALLGVDVDLSGFKQRADSLLFGESQSRIVISFDERHRDALMNAAVAAGVPCTILGHVADHVMFNLRPFMSESLIELRDVYLKCLPSWIANRLWPRWRRRQVLSRRSLEWRPRPLLNQERHRASPTTRRSGRRVAVSAPARDGFKKLLLECSATTSILKWLRSRNS
jgi:phosphoribosylformylglycinamidine synthase